MDLSYIHQQLKNINLNIDPNTIQQVENFLINDIGLINQIELDYQIYASLAIVSETKTLPNIQNTGLSQIGIKIENVMSHLGKLSKQKFLDTLNKQLQKLKKAPQYMKKKVEDIRYSYRFYKKYQITFQSLFLKLLPHIPSSEQFSALFWVLYLYIKNQFIENQNITEAKFLLILIFRFIFQNFISQASFYEIFSILECKIGSIPQISIQKHQFYLSKLGQKMDYFYRRRFNDPHTNFNKIIENNTYLDRLVDDMSTQYVRDQSKLRYFNEINELSYLQLKKNLTPQVFRIHVSAETVEAISKQLSFDSDEQIDQQPPQQTPIKVPNIISEKDLIRTPQNQNMCQNNISPNQTPTWRTVSIPKFSPNFTLEDNPQSTPISKKIYNQKWMNDRISSMTTQQNHQLMKMFDTLDQKLQKIEQPNNNLLCYLREKIHQLIKQFTPKCFDFEARYQRMFSFFLTNLNDIRSQYGKLFQIDQNSKPNLKQLLIAVCALTCEIFNYINNSITYQFKRHLEVFNISISLAAKTIELFDQFVSKKMPIDLKNYLSNVKKRFMVSDIWENEAGFKLLFSSKNYPQKEQMIQKIYSFTRKRIQEICSQAKIQAKIISKTVNIMKCILQKKPYLLKKNNIDQIILCCIMSCLSINQKHQHQSLEMLFQSYNSNIRFAFNSNQLGLKDHQGNEMKIIDYYNDVFLQEMQDLLAQNQTQLDDYLLTPVRISQSFNIDNIGRNMVKIKQKPLLPGNFLFNPQKAPLGKSSYRKQLIKQAKQMEMKQEREQNEQDPPSPTFGCNLTLRRHFSFGRDPSKN